MRYLLLLSVALFVGCSAPMEQGTDQQNKTDVEQVDSSITGLIYEGETHFKSLRQLTFGGDNAEAYWSFKGDNLVFQATNPAWGDECDQIRVFDPFNDDLGAAPATCVSTGKGRTTCSYFLPGDSTIVYASTHLGSDECPPVPEKRTDGKYVWPIYESFDIFMGDLSGNVLERMTDTPGYDAEATVSPRGDKIVFTSMRDGDLELYTMNIDGSDVNRVTNALGYDGGAFFSPDGSKLIFRASRPESAEEKKTYKDLLAQGLVMPTQMELFVCNVDGSEMRQITELGKANWCPFWHPSGEKVIFASNYESERGFPFSLYLIDLDGNNLKRISNEDAFGAFPVFSPDGKHLVFSSNRNNGGTRETNLFLAEWAE